MPMTSEDIVRRCGMDIRTVNVYDIRLDAITIESIIRNMLFV